MQLPRAVHLLCLGTLINRAGTMLLPFLTLYLHKHLELSKSFATWAMGCYGLGAVAAAIVGGQLADAVGRRRIMLTALIGGSAVLCAFPFVRSQSAIIVCVFLFAFLAEMYRPAASAMIADLVEPVRRPHAFGLMYFSINVGFSIGPLLAGLLLDYLSFRWLIWIDAATALIYASIIWRMVPETLPRRVPGGSESGTQPDQPHVPALEAAGHILRDRVFVVYCLATVAISLVYMQAMSTLPLYLQDEGFREADYGQIISVNGILITVLQLPMVSLLHRLNRAWVVSLASLVTGLGFFLTIAAVTKWHYMLTVAVWTLGEIMAAAFASAIVADLAPVRLRARYMGVFGVSFSSSNMIGAPLGGMILERHGGGAVWTSSFGLAVLSCVLYLSIRRHIAAGPAELAAVERVIAANAPPPSSSLPPALHPADSTTAHHASGTIPQ